MNPVVLGGIAGGVLALIIVGIVIWKVVHSAAKSEDISDDGELDLIAEQTMADTLAEPEHYVTEANVLTSEGKALTANFLEDSDDHSDD
jgi:hypothetical protein